MGLLLIIQQLDHFEFVPIPSPQIAGDSFTVTIYALDAANQPVTNYNGHPFVYSSRGFVYCYKQVSFLNGSCTEKLMVTLADYMALICHDFNLNVLDTSNYFTVIPNVPSKLLSLVPNEIHEPGTTDGKGGTPIGQIAGVPFSVSIYITDIWYNIVDTVNHLISFTTNDQFVQSSQIQLTNGYAVLPFAFRTAGTRRFYFNDLTSPTIKQDTSSSISIYPGEYARLLVLLPGENHLPGDTTTNTSATPGKYGVPYDQYVLEDFQVTVYATDSMWNKTGVSGNAIQLSGSSGFSNPPPQNLSNGEVTFTANFSTSGEKFLLARDINNNFYSYDNFLRVVSRANNFDISVNPDTISPGEIAYITVTVYDRNNNPIEGKWVNFSVIGGNGYIIAQYDTVQTNAQGVCQSQFTITSGYFNELDTIMVSADNYAETTTVYVIIPDSSVMEGNIVAYPNPFGKINQPYTRFVYYLQQHCNVIYAIYDAFGNCVHYEEIASGQNGARMGINTLTWYGKNDKNKRVASGVYYVLIKGYLHTNIFLEKRIRVGVIW